MATFASARAELLRRIGGGVDAVTATAGDTTTITVNDDERIIGSGALADEELKHLWILMLTGSAAADIRRVSTHAEDTGILTIPTTPTFTASVDAGDTFELWGAMNPRRARFAIELALREMYHQELFPLTLVNDGDFEVDDGSAGDPAAWASTNATVRKDTDAADVVTGARSLSVATTAVNGYAQSDNIRVGGGSALHLWVDARAPAATAKVWVIDITNANAELATQTWAHGDFGVMEAAIDVPSTCDNIAIRLGAEENSATVHFDNCQVIRNGRHIYELPTWFDIAVHQYALAVNFYGTRPYSREPRGQFPAIPLHNPRAANPNRILFERAPHGQPWIVAARAHLGEEATISSDATVINANLKWVVDNALLKALDLILQDQGSANVEDWAERRQAALREAQRSNKRWQYEMPAKPVKVDWSGLRV